VVDAAGEGVGGKKNANGERVNVLRVLMVASDEDTVERCSKETGGGLQVGRNVSV